MLQERRLTTRGIVHSLATVALRFQPAKTRRWEPFRSGPHQAQGVLEALAVALQGELSEIATAPGLSE